MSRLTSEIMPCHRGHIFETLLSADCMAGGYLPYMQRKEVSTIVTEPHMLRLVHSGISVWEQIVSITRYSMCSQTTHTLLGYIYPITPWYVCTHDLVLDQEAQLWVNVNIHIQGLRKWQAKLCFFHNCHVECQYVSCITFTSSLKPPDLLLSMLRLQYVAYKLEETVVITFQSHAAQARLRSHIRNSIVLVQSYPIKSH